MDELISKQAAIAAMAELQGRASTKAELKGISKAWKRIKQLPSAQPEPHWIPVTKEETFKAGYEGREIRFRVDGRLFAIRELAQ